jgi:hypothetical protein
MGAVIGAASVSESLALRLSVLEAYRRAKLRDWARRFWPGGCNSRATASERYRENSCRETVALVAAFA